MKNPFLKISTVVEISTLAFALIYGCQPPDETAPVRTPPSTHLMAVASDTGIRGTKLATVILEGGHQVGFYEFTAGQVGIRHVQPVDEKGNAANARQSHRISSTLDALVQQGKSTVDIYRAISPQPDTKTLRTLQQADERRQLAEREATLTEERPGDQLTHPPLMEPQGIGQSGSPQARTANGCAPDYYNDHYGANWFLERYCVEGAYRWCQTNWLWASSGLRETKWFKTCAMAADFNTRVRFRGYKWERFCGLWSCEWWQGVKWDYQILPRMAECWYYTSKGWYESRADGLEPCQKVHFSVLYNQ